MGAVNGGAGWLCQLRESSGCADCVRLSSVHRAVRQQMPTQACWIVVPGEAF